MSEAVGASSRRVFISHASADAGVAREIYRDLAKRGIACWIAPDHIPPGKGYAERIVAAIDECRVLMVLISRACNGSVHVPREIEQAMHRQRHLMPVRIEEVEPTGAISYYLGTVQRIEAHRGGIEGHLDEIAEAAARLLELPPPPPPGWYERMRRRRRLIAGAVALACLPLLLLMRPMMREWMNLDWPDPDRTVKLAVYHRLASLDMREVTYDYRGIHVGDRLFLKPSAPAGMHAYLLNVAGDHRAKIIDWEVGGPEQMFKDQAGNWYWTPEPGPSEVILLVAGERPLDAAERSRLVEEITGLGQLPELKEDQQIVWFDGKWKLVRAGRRDRSSTFDGRWADGLASVLQRHGLQFDGRTLPLRPSDE